MSIVKRVVGLPLQFGGEEHEGWLPPGAARPLPTQVRHVVLDIEIEFDGHGYLLCWMSRDHSVVGDTWHQSLADAEKAATKNFGVQPLQWQIT